MIRQRTTVSRWTIGALLCGALGVSGCVARPVTTVSREVITRPAPIYTPVELQLATEELDRARLALTAREYERARLLADQALVDAQIAETRAATETARQTARNLRLNIETVRDEAIRSATAYTTTPLPLAAPLELRLATEELDRARLALDAREYERARRLADQAAAYAQIAEARAEDESSRRLARRLRLTSEDLRAEAARVSVAALPPYPPLELRLARDELDRARLALDAREYERARILADQALADAQAAEARAVTESERQAARDLRLSIVTLQSDAVRLANRY
jgi:hypothetical protein